MLHSPMAAGPASAGAMAARSGYSARLAPMFVRAGRRRCWPGTCSGYSSVSFLPTPGVSEFAVELPRCPRL